MRTRQRGFARGRQVAAPIELDLRSLEVFLHVAETGSMTAAARRLGLTQSAVSQAVANLEESLGARLVDRGVRPLAATPAGSVLVEQGEALLRQARRAVQAVREPASALLPHLNLALVDSVAATVGPHLVAELGGIAAQWSIWSGLSASHQEALVARKLDVIVSIDGHELNDNLVRHEILAEPFVLMLPKGFGATADSLAGLARAADLVRFTARSTTGQQVERHLRRLRVEARGRIEFDTADAVAAMVAGGHGWALTTPLCVLQAAAHLAAVELRPMPRPMLWRRLVVVARRDELGEVPARIARACVATLRRVCLPAIAAAAPWMAQAMALPGRRADDSKA